MKKIFALCLVFVMLTGLSACGGKTDDGSDPSSSAPESSKPVILGSALQTSDADSSGEDVATDGDGSVMVEYTSVAEGYIDHFLDYDYKIVYFVGFECMDDEVLFIPKGTIIMCDKRMAVHCYDKANLFKADQLKYSTYLTKRLGQSLTSILDVQLNAPPVTFTAEEDLLVRFSVKGSLSDVKLYPPKGLEDKIRIMTEADCIKEFFED